MEISQNYEMIRDGTLDANKKFTDSLFKTASQPRTDEGSFAANHHKRSVPVRFDNKIPSIRSLILESVGSSVINKIYLFGSYAHGNPNEDSDIDLCVVVNDGIDRLDTYKKIIHNLWENKIMPCDLLVYNAKVFFNVENPRSIENTIIKEGRLLYG